jgi:hypothetical protein
MTLKDLLRRIDELIGMGSAALATVRDKGYGIASVNNDLYFCL